MTSLGPAPAPPLLPLRPGDREPRERGRQASPSKASPRGSAKRNAEAESAADFEKDEGAHQLDERA